MKITAHCLVKNEENFVWFAINSVIDYVDEVMVWDQGSRDSTISIIKSINNPKIKFKQASGKVEELRQKMIEETSADWLFILDGDEVWYQDAIGNLTANIKKTKCLAIVSPNYLLVGDIFHHMEEAAGKYNIAGRVGHYNIRAIKKTPGLHIEGTYPNEAYVTKEGIKVQDLPAREILFLEEKYLHASFLPRSQKDMKKLKLEVGIEFPKDYYYPEVFFKERPDLIANPWRLANSGFNLVSLALKPLRKLKRSLV